MKKKYRTKDNKSSALNRLLILMIKTKIISVGSWPTMITWEKKFVYKFPKEFL